MSSTLAPAAAVPVTPLPVIAVVATTAEVLARPDLSEDLLAPWELGRLARIRLPRRRDDVLAARLLLRLCVAHLTGNPPGQVQPAQHCAQCGGAEHGRPYLPGLPHIGVSLSHADGVVAAAAGPGPLGIDVEPRIRRPAPLPVVRRLFPHEDPHDGAAVLRAWVRREALFKAGGPDFNAGGSDLKAQGSDSPHLVEWTDHRRGAVAALASARPATVTQWSAVSGSGAGPEETTRGHGC
ncbi:4-phosphopantetheinyl transferase [Streptomyces sp. NPDC059070]|uniref:4-phosphopantetheinyl transferase n=1 Tax=Streptomyces sp. NPDC059070 TaxID=3346713 RepID=UPI00367BFF4A